jgi:uncharacterized protein (DUF362 family)
VTCEFILIIIVLEVLIYRDQTPVFFKRFLYESVGGFAMKLRRIFMFVGIVSLLWTAAFPWYFVIQGQDAKRSNVIQSERIKQDREKHLMEVMKQALAEPEPNPVVGIGRGQDYEKTTLTAIENAGGLKDIVKKGDLVLIKPNICGLDRPGAPTITDYRVVQAIANLVIKYGAARVMVAEGAISGDAFDTISARVNKYGTIKGVQLMDFNSLSKEDCYELKSQKSLTGKAIYIPKIYMDADVVITVPKLKTHNLNDAVVTLSLKNAFGVPPGQLYGGNYGFKSGLHSLGLKEAILDINRIRKPDMAVIEGIVGGEGYGPLNNTPVKSNIIIVGRDLVAVDTVALTFMGFTVDQVPYVELASKEKMGVSDLSKVKIVGADLNAIKMHFKR